MLRRGPQYSISDTPAMADAFLVWVKNKGVRVGNDSWITKASRKLSSVLAAEDGNTQATLDKAYPVKGEAMYNISEIIELSKLQKFLDTQDTKILKEKLQKVVVGQDSVLTETQGGSEARNTRFELSSCAALIELGYNAILTDLNPDIEIKERKRKVAIECKRVFNGTDENIIERLRDGIKQLEQRDGGRKYDFRLVMIDVTRVITGGEYHLNGPVEEAYPLLQSRLNAKLHIIKKELKRSQLLDAVIMVYSDHITEPGGGEVFSNVHQNDVVIGPHISPQREVELMRVLRKMIVAWS